MGSVISAGKGSLLYSGPASSVSRTNLTIFQSKDAGKSWSVDRVIHVGPSGYSDLAMLSSGEVGILYENGVKEHINSFAERISLSLF